MTGVITWDQIVGLIAIGGALGGMWWRLQAQMAAIQKDLDAYKLAVAKEYATSASIREVEERVVEAINRLGDRLDKFFTPRNRA